MAEEEKKILTPQETRHDLIQAIRGSNDVLATASTVFTIFPDTLTLDRAKLTVTKRNFFQSSEVMSIQIEDILNVTAVVGPLFGTVNIASRVFTSGPYKVGKFLRDDALRLKRITQGYVIALQREIDCNALSSAELSVLLDQLGEDDHQT